MSSTWPRVGRATFVRRDVVAALVPWIVARAIVLPALALARFMFDEIGRGPRPVQLTQGLFGWDAAFYRDIATHGYDALPRQALRFFTLVPIVARGLGTVLLDHPDVALIIVANLSALVFLALIHRIAELETGDEGLSHRAVWFAAVFPAASVLVMGYADATMLALGVGFFLAIRTGRWRVAAGLGFLGGLCRPLGCLLVLPGLIEASRGWGAAPVRERRGLALAVLGPPLGLVGFLSWAGVTRGDVFLPIRVQNDAELRGGFQDPFTRLVDGFGDLFGGDRFGSGLHALWAVVFVVLLVVLGRRFAASYTVFAGASVLIALSARNLDSFERYGMGAFPLVLALASLTRARDVERGVLVLFGAGLAGYAVLTFLGLYVP